MLPHTLALFSCLRRYTLRGQPESLNPVLLRIMAIIMSAIGFSLSFIEEAPIAVPIVFAGERWCKFLTQAIELLQNQPDVWTERCRTMRESCQHRSNWATQSVHVTTRENMAVCDSYSGPIVCTEM